MKHTLQLRIAAKIAEKRSAGELQASAAASCSWHKRFTVATATSVPPRAKVDRLAVRPASGE